MTEQNKVLSLGQVDLQQVASLLNRFGLQLEQCAPATEIPGSYWGEREAGLVRDVVYARQDTPLHSLLHESCHYICMDAARRAQLHTDAGGDFAEEDAVCYLQIVLADYIEQFGRTRMLADMDAWGYTFRLGSAQAWFDQDATDALQWLIHRGVLDAQRLPTWRLRQ